MVDRPVIVWFTRDLRLADNPALRVAARQGPVVPVFILQDDRTVDWPPGGASRWWLARSLRSLAGDLAALGSKLILRRGDPAAVLPALARDTGAGAVHWSRAYEPDIMRAQEAVRATLEADGVSVNRFGGRLLFEPEDVATRDGAPYKVFTPFYKAVLAHGGPSAPVAAPDRLDAPAD